MASTKRVAVVTGANKGIGYAIVRALCKAFDGDVILTARDEGRGQQAIKDLNGEGLEPRFHQLDLDDAASAERLRDFLKDQYGGLDVLVNNAGIAYKSASTAPFGEQAEVSMKTNFFGTLNVYNTLRPLLRPHARIVNVSSMASQFALKKCNDEVRGRILDPSLTIDKLQNLMNEFVALAKEGKHLENGWPGTAYGTSKIGVTAMTIVHQRELDAANSEDIIVNCCCPGYVDTDMSSHKGTKTIDQGAETPVMLASIPPNATSPRGQYLSEKQVQPWG